MPIFAKYLSACAQKGNLVGLTQMMGAEDDDTGLGRMSST